jgi:hypothetical protein
LGGDDVALVPEKTFGTAAARNSDPGADLRGNYELAAAVGTREAWQAFLNSYGQSGFYADLARAQLGKIVAAERAQAVADEASRRAENIDKSKGSAAADRARADAIEKAKVAAAAEKEKLDEAERAKQQAAQITGSQAQQLAAISPGKTQEPTAQRPPIEELPRLVQAELRRVGCYTGSVTSDWNTNARASLERFNKHSGQRLETRTASLDAFDVIRSKSGRVCPLTCQHGYRAQGETCVAIVCRTGYILGDDNECEPARAAKSKAAARSKPQGDIPPAEAAVGAKSDAGVTCNARGCRTVPAGCKRETFFGDGRITEAHERIVCP